MFLNARQRGRLQVESTLRHSVYSPAGRLLLLPSSHLRSLVDSLTSNVFPYETSNLLRDIRKRSARINSSLRKRIQKYPK